MRSYWEHDHWFKNIDFFVIGGGFTGLFSALSLRAKFPDSKIVLAERDSIAHGASTKNAGFACFGSLGEILDDLKDESLDGVLNRVEKRFNGLQKLREIIPDAFCDFETTGGIELFQKGEELAFEHCQDRLSEINQAVKPKLGFEPYELADISKMGFKGLIGGISIQKEGMLHPAKAIDYLRKSCLLQKIEILNGFNVDGIESIGDGVEIISNQTRIRTKRAVLATNAFTRSLIKDDSLVPARGQVLITSPIPDLPFKGTFHLDKGFIYFRNVGERVLLGGARNLDFKGEANTKIELNDTIQEHLESFLRNKLLSNRTFEIEHRWAGIMGFGAKGEKEPIIKEVQPNVFAAYRLGGMGVAISAQVAEDLAELIKPNTSRN